MGHRRIMEIDRLSNLPQDIIEDILSRTLLKDAIRTSVLSSTWRRLWASHPVLLLHWPFYRDNFYRKTKFRKRNIKRFVDSVSKILSLHVGAVRILKLFVPNTRDFDISPSMDRWIDGILCDYEFSLSNFMPHPYKLPHHFFDYCKLTYLRLSKCILEPPHGFGGFPNLTVLILWQVTFAASCTFEALLPSAEFLEHLGLIGCTGVVNMRVDAPRLHMLWVQHEKEFAFAFGLFGRTPNLEDVALPGRNTLQKHGNAANLTKLLSSMPKVLSLKLSGSNFATFAGTIPESLPTPLDLTNLDICGLRWSELHQLSSVLCILRSSPKLRKFKINCVGGNAEAMVHLKRPKCLEHPLGQLQTIELPHVEVSRVMLAFISRLLAKTPLLKKMTIGWRPGTNADVVSRFSTRIMGLDRVSTVPTSELFVIEANSS